MRLERLRFAVNANLDLLTHFFASPALGYILFDTWLIMDKLSPHEYVLGAIMLYLVS